MAITLDQIIAEVNDLSLKRDAADAAHAATVDALNAVVLAQANSVQKQVAQDTAEANEQASFDQLIEDLNSFKGGQ